MLIDCSPLYRRLATSAYFRGPKKANMEFVPPYGAQGVLYLRPLLFGSGARIGLQPSDEYTLLVLATPVSNSYYKGGMKPTSAVVIEDYDRAAPKGVGNVKVSDGCSVAVPQTERQSLLAFSPSFDVGLCIACAA